MRAPNAQPAARLLSMTRPGRSVARAVARVARTAAPLGLATSAPAPRVQAVQRVATRGYAAVAPSPDRVSEFAQHAEMLASLDLAEQNLGVFDGEWRGAGERVLALNPSTGRIIAEVITGSEADLDAAIAKSRSAWEQWRIVGIQTRWSYYFPARPSTWNWF